MATDGTNSNCITCWANLEPMQVALYLAGEITQVKESISWVRCASGNVLLFLKVFHLLAGLEINQQKNVKMGSVSNVTLVGS